MHEQNIIIINLWIIIDLDPYPVIIHNLRHASCTKKTFCAWVDTKGQSMDYSSLGDRSRMKRRHSDLQRRGLASGLSPEKNIVREDHQNAPPDRLSLPIVVR